MSLGLKVSFGVWFAEELVGSLAEVDNLSLIGEEVLLGGLGGEGRERTVALIRSGIEQILMHYGLLALLLTAPYQVNPSMEVLRDEG